MTQTSFGTRSTTVTMTVDGRRTSTLADSTAGRRTSSWAARSVCMRKTFGVPSIPRIDWMIDTLVKVAPLISSVRPANAGATLTARIPARQAAMNRAATSCTDRRRGELRLTGWRRTCDPERPAGRPRLITRTSRRQVGYGRALRGLPARSTSRLRTGPRTRVRCRTARRRRFWRVRPGDGRRKPSHPPC